MPTGVEHGTVTAVSGGQPFEITTLRRDVETDGRRAVVAFTDDWAEDAQRRDFRLNALYADAEGHVFDPTGEGVADARAGRVVFVGDPRDAHPGRRPAHPALLPLPGLVWPRRAGRAEPRRLRAAEGQAGRSVGRAGFEGTAQALGSGRSVRGGAADGPDGDPDAGAARDRGSGPVRAAGGHRDRPAVPVRSLAAPGGPAAARPGRRPSHGRGAFACPTPSATGWPPPWARNPASSPG